MLCQQKLDVLLILCVCLCVHVCVHVRAKHLCDCLSYSYSVLSVSLCQEYPVLSKHENKEKVSITNIQQEKEDCCFSMVSLLVCASKYRVWMQIAFGWNHWVRIAMVPSTGISMALACTKKNQRHPMESWLQTGINVLRFFCRQGNGS